MSLVHTIFQGAWYLNDKYGRGVYTQSQMGFWLHSGTPETEALAYGMLVDSQVFPWCQFICLE